MHEQLRADLIAEAHALAASIGMKFVPHAPKEPTMQTDIVERLNEFRAKAPSISAPVSALMREAAETIATLRREVEEARAKALEEAALLVDNCEYKDIVYPETMSDERDNIAAAIRSLADKEG